MDWTRLFYKALNVVVRFRNPSTSASFFEHFFSNFSFHPKTANDELKRKMYGCILVVGGGMKFVGIGKWLQNRVGLQIPFIFRSEHLDIVTSPKDMDPAMTAWKGAAVMSCLESAPELWIVGSDWAKNGVRILREKAPFMW